MGWHWRDWQPFSMSNSGQELSYFAATDDYGCLADTAMLAYIA